MSARQVVGVGVVAVVVALAAPVPVSEAAPATGVMAIVQAVPGANVRVAIDGKQVESSAGVGSLLGPYDVATGRHSVRFVDPSSKISTTTTVTVRAGTSTDVVLHRPASVGGTPVVNVYKTPRRPIGPGKARVLVAHTATVAPADVEVDGQVVFRNIANGEFAEADVPAGEHAVKLLPAGQRSNPILGPINVNLAARTVTMVYAVGTPKNGSMDVIAHATRLSPDGSVVPDTIKTGSAGLAAGAVSTFGRASSEPAGQPMRWWGAAALAVAVLLVGRRRALAVIIGRRAPAATRG